MNLLHPDHSTPSRRSSASSRRRGFLGLGAAIAALGLAGCGFELRKAPVFAFRTIAVPGNSNIVRMLRRSLPLGGNVQVLPPEQASEADAVLDIVAENQERGVLSTNSSGQVRELQLRLKVSFRLVAPRTGKVLLPPTEIVQTRDISFNETAALAKEGEEQLLFRDMQNDIVQQMLRRLAAVKEL
ncbi:MAG: hypothetical protein EOO22_01350 [Comamonadaceae bacterium]|nr:MAG: hypothetical protein EOO22_01350 [Comamonadaceae bacterium]